MNTVFKYRIQFFSLALSYLIVFVAVLMAMVMGTARDRDNYLTLFADPFVSSRIEIGFHYYAKAFALLHVPPDAAIVLTCVLIYTLMAWAWFAWVRINWLESILLFNFFVFSLFNYYLGTSLRMGLATAMALYAAIRIAQGKIGFLIVLWMSGLFQYGTIPFALTFSWIVATRRWSWRLHKLIIAVVCVALPISVAAILQQLGLGSHYMAYFNEGQGQTSRIFPFTYAFFTLALFLSSFRGADTVLRRAVFYGLPFLLYGVFSGITIFSKMLIPNIFLSAILVTVEYRAMYIKNIELNMRLLVSVILNCLAMIYALNAYHYI